MSEISRNIIVDISNMLSEVSPSVSGELNPDHTLAEIGLDSIQVVQFGMLLEKHFGNDVIIDEWIDIEHGKGRSGFKLSSLVDYVISKIS